MKRLFLFVVIATLVPMLAQAFDLNDLKKILGGDKTDNTTTEQSAGASASGSALGNFISGILSKEDLDVCELVGTWNYSAPAVSFRSENFLKKAGGVAAATAIEQKLEPYYKTTGLNQLILTVNTDSTFTFNVKGIKLSGTISKLEKSDDSDYNFEMSFTALKNIKLTSYKVYITKSGQTMDLMFDATKLVDIAKKVSAVANSATLKATVSLLESYEGVCVGFTLKK